MDSIADIETYLTAMDLPDRALKIVDIGAHSGKFTSEIKKRFPCVSFMFEPSPKQFEKLVTDFPADFVFSYGVSDKKKKSGFVCYGGTLSQLDRVTDNATVQAENTLIEIQMVSLDSIHSSILASNHIDILKIDTEGQELNVLKGAHQLLTNKAISYIFFEVGGTYTDLGYRVGDVIRLLNSYGYSVYDFVEGKPVKLTPDFDDHSLRDLFATYLPCS